MKPQFPFKVPYVITQGYDNIAARYNYNHHGAIDAVPNPKLSDIYPTLPGYVLDIQNPTSISAGKAVTINSEIDAGLIKYLKSRGLVPLNYNGRVFIKHSYHHGLEIYVKEGQVVNQDTPIMKCGNTGMVYSGGVPVPDNEKGVPPYRGLHVHFDTVIHPNDTSHPFNLDWDRIGRVDPLLILNYKVMQNKFFIKQGSKIGVIVLEGFTFGGGFAKDQESLKKLQESFEIPNDAATLEIPQ
jgi:murein DD-endopeptidase MepM/ murein hydrolase activator NlpD